MAALKLFPLYILKNKIINGTLLLKRFPNFFLLSTRKKKLKYDIFHLEQTMLDSNVKKEMKHPSEYGNVLG